MLKCDKCGGKIFDGSKYCPSCGDPVTAADRPSSDLSECDVAQVEISFGKSSSANYENAIRICRNIPTYREKQEAGTTRHKVIIPLTEIDLLNNLYELVGNWKASKMLINGQPSTKSALVYKGMGCYREWQKAYNRKQFCFGERPFEYNIWGCKKLGMPVTEFGAEWLTFGALDSQGVWQFDKNRIRHQLELKIHEYELCPVLDRPRILDTLAHLPDSINPKTNKNWSHQTTFQEIRGKWKEVAIGVKPIIRSANQYIVGDFQPEWKIEGTPQEGSSQISDVEYTMVKTAKTHVLLPPGLKPMSEWEDPHEKAREHKGLTQQDIDVIDRGLIAEHSGKKSIQGAPTSKSSCLVTLLGIIGIIGLSFLAILLVLV